jgi:hypothetical protein
MASQEWRKHLAVSHLWLAGNEERIRKFGEDLSKTNPTIHTQWAITSLENVLVQPTRSRGSSKGSSAQKDSDTLSNNPDDVETDTFMKTPIMQEILTEAGDAIMDIVHETMIGFARSDEATNKAITRFTQQRQHDPEGPQHAEGTSCGLCHSDLPYPPIVAHNMSSGKTKFQHRGVGLSWMECPVISSSGVQPDDLVCPRPIASEQYRCTTCDRVFTASIRINHKGRPTDIPPQPVCPWCPNSSVPAVHDIGASGNMSQFTGMMLPAGILVSTTTADS